MGSLYTPITTKEASDDVLVRALTYGAEKIWSGPITYSFPTSATDYPSNYTSTFDGDKYPDTFIAANDFLINNTQRALDKDWDTIKENNGFTVEGFTQLDVSQATVSSEATIRVAYADLRPGALASTFSPSTLNAAAGDFWVSDNSLWSATNSSPGTYNSMAVFHEIGHALGLKHTHEYQASTHPALSDGWDSPEYTVMSYTKLYDGAPQSFMSLDIQALQYLYGANFNIARGDTTYSWAPTSGDTVVNGVVAIDSTMNRILMTVWDGGGNDTYDLSAYVDRVFVNLNAGSSSLLSSKQTGYHSDRSHAAFNVSNAFMFEGDQRSLIENAIGGAGDDTINGNQIANKLSGGDGNDSLNGLFGNDMLRGGAGIDELDGSKGDDNLRGGLDADIFHFSVGHDKIVDFENGADQLEYSKHFWFESFDDIVEHSYDTKAGLVITTDDDMHSVLIRDFYLRDLDQTDFVNV